MSLRQIEVHFQPAVKVRQTPWTTHLATIMTQPTSTTMTSSHMRSLRHDTSGIWIGTYPILSTLRRFTNHFIFIAYSVGDAGFGWSQNKYNLIRWREWICTVVSCRAWTPSSITIYTTKRYSPVFARLSPLFASDFGIFRDWRCSTSFNSAGWKRTSGRSCLAQSLIAKCC